MASVRVVFHYLSAAAASLNIDLKKDGIKFLRDAYSILVDDAFKDKRINNTGKIERKVAVGIKSHGTGDDVIRNDVDRFWKKEFAFFR